MKNYLKYIALLTLLLLLSIKVDAQEKKVLRQTISTNGGSFKIQLNESSILVQQSIGQGGNIGTFKNSKTLVHQGFIQPNKSSLNFKTKDPNFNPVCYPNPFSDELSIKFENLVTEKINLQLSDLSGRIINNTVHESTQELLLNFSEVDPGLYLLIIQIENVLTTTKIQKQ